MGGMGSAQPSSTNLRYHCGPSQASGLFVSIGQLYLSGVLLGEIKEVETDRKWISPSSNLLTTDSGFNRRVNPFGGI